MPVCARLISVYTVTNLLPSISHNYIPLPTLIMYTFPTVICGNQQFSDNIVLSSVTSW